MAMHWRIYEGIPQCLARILQHVDKIQGQGVSGFMKLPYKNTREFSHLERKADNFYPRNPKAKNAAL